MNGTGQHFVSLAAGAILLLLFAYVFVRTVSFAYFRTRLEFFRGLIREQQKKKDGE